MADFVLLKIVSGRPEAEILRGFLESHGVNTRILADDVGGLRPHLAWSGGVRVEVLSSDLHVAKQLLSEVQSTDSSAE